MEMCYIVHMERPFLFIEYIIWDCTPSTGRRQKTPGDRYPWVFCIFFRAVDSINLILFNWFTSLAPGS